MSAGKPDGPVTDAAPTGPLERGPASFASPPTFEPGDLLAGRFRVVRFLGRGGMGEVYEAEDLEVRDRVAIKAIRPDLAGDEQAINRFRQEIHLARKVTHPNVCRVFDLFRHRRSAAGGELAEVAFVSMELLPGETLAERLQRGPLAEAEALPLVRQVASALDAAHRAGVIHQDLKSANVVLVSTSLGPRAVVTDFGLARPRDAATPVGEVMGTPAYMSPEQVEGGPVSPATDVYALGVMLFEMVTGQLPFPGATPVLAARRRLLEPAPTARELAPGLSAAWDAAIARCLERSPERRFRSAGELVAALTGERARFSLEEELVRTRTRSRVVVAGALLLLGAAAFLTQGAAERTPAASQGTAVQFTASEGLDIFPAFSPDGATLAYSSNRSGHFELYLKSRGAGGQDQQITRDGAENFQPVFSPDGHSVAYHAQRKGGIWVVPVAGGEPRRLTEFGSRPAWSPDGSALAFQGDGLVDLAANSFPARPPSTIWVVAATGGAPTQVTEPSQPPGGHGTPSWSADGTRLVFASYDRRASSIWTLRLEDHRLQPLVGGEALILDPVLAADGRSLLYVAHQSTGDVGAWRIPLGPDGRPRGSAARVGSLGASNPRHLALAPDGHTIAYSALSLSTNLWSLPLTDRGDPAGPAHPLTSERARNSRPVFSPDGRRLAFEKWFPGGKPDIWVMDQDGGNPQQLTSDPAPDTAASFLPDGRVAFLSFRQGQRALWAVDPASGASQRLLAFEGQGEFPRVSPDGSLVAFDSDREGSTMNLWLQPLAGGPARRLTFDRELLAYAAWSPDGRWLAAQMRRGEDTHVVVVAAAGGEPQVLTRDAGQSWPNSFSPDGERIAYARQRDGLWNLWWVSRRGGEQRQLTRHEAPAAYVRYPAWSPRGDRLVYEHAETTGNVWLLERLDQP
jgi:Tol biopolymer transport system component